MHMEKESKCKIWCVSCAKEVDAQLTSGKEVYPRRKDLKNVPFWKCPYCGNWVGTHYKSNNKLRPLGVIADKKMKKLRIAIHSKLDDVWQNGDIPRSVCYKWLSAKLGYEYHTGNLRSISEASKVLKLIDELKSKTAIIEIKRHKKGGTM